MTRRSTPWGPLMAGASALTTLGAIPPFLLGAQAVLIMAELDFGTTRLGIAVSVFFVASAGLTVLGSGFLQRQGPGSLIAAGLLVAAGGLGTALLVHHWIGLIVAMAVLGAGNAACQGTSNRAVATLLPPQRRGLGFGLKQSAVPLAVMLGGLAVPTTAVLFGWRATFLVTGSIGVLVALGGVLVLLRGRDIPPSNPSAPPPGPSAPELALERAPWGPLVLCGVAITLASAAGNFLGAYLASWAHEVGLSVEQAGLLMAAGSGSSVIVRILAGIQADRRHGNNLAVVMTMTAIGAACLAMLGAVPTVPVVIVFGFLAFALGWAWPGLFLYAVARVGRGAPGQASSVVQTGAFAGGAVGPVTFGLMVSVLGYQGAWWAAAGAFVIATLLTLLARRGFRRDLRERPPMEPFSYGGGRRSPRFTTSPPE